MYTYMVEYVIDSTLKAYTMLVSADDFSKAYIDALLLLPRSAMITELFQV